MFSHDASHPFLVICSGSSKDPLVSEEINEAATRVAPGRAQYSGQTADDRPPNECILILILILLLIGTYRVWDDFAVGGKRPLVGETASHHAALPPSSSTTPACPPVDSVHILFAAGPWAGEGGTNAPAPCTSIYVQDARKFSLMCTSRDGTNAHSLLCAVHFSVNSNVTRYVRL